MLLERGPIPQLYNPFNVPTPQDPGFSKLVASDTTVLDEIEPIMDLLVVPDAIIDLLPPDDGIDAGLATIDAGLSQVAEFDYNGNADALDPLQQQGTEGFYEAYSAIPGEAFQPVPPPIVYAGGGQPFQADQAIVASIANLTRPGATDFLPGETYQISIAINPVNVGAAQVGGIEVFIDIVQDAAAVPFGDLGTTDQYGHLQCTGIFQDADVGNWSFQPFAQDAAGNNLGGNNVAWTVNALPPGVSSDIPPGEVINTPGLHPVCTIGGPAAGTPITVNLTNTASGNSTAFVQGDTWTLNVTGAAKQDVVIWATQNGTPLPKLVLGQTDANGNFTLTGNMDLDLYLGVWREFYQVGASVWNGELDFTVSAVTPPALVHPPGVPVPIITAPSVGGPTSGGPAAPFNPNLAPGSFGSVSSGAGPAQVHPPGVPVPIVTASSPGATPTGTFPGVSAL